MAKADRLKWWRQVRFGMFIHWGLYAVPAGVWKGKEIDGIGEWIMYRAQIPVKEYEKLGEKFNPRKFNARQVVKLARDAGMKYIVITAKHHDGFAMYRSPSCKYNIADATPYKKDPMKALAGECRKAGLRLCFYYSQYQDWHHPNGARNSWDYDEEKKDLDQYIEEKVKPQLRELLTQYGPVGLIWFDTPGKMTRQQSMSLRRLVHRLQPKCLVSGRVGNGLGDYGSLGDNQIPRGRMKGNWETPATLNDTWGYKKNDHEWKTVKSLVCLMGELAGKGVNYLLNIGPTAEGAIPGPSIKRLKDVGKWMKANGEAVYGTSASPWPCDFAWGNVTTKRGKLYLLIRQWKAGRFTLYGLGNKVKGARLLAGGKRLEFAQSKHKVLGTDVLEIVLPKKAPDRNVSVVVLDIAGAARADQRLFQRPDGSIVLPAHMAELCAARGNEKFKKTGGGFIEGWLKRGDAASWRFKAAKPGRYVVSVTSRGSNDKWGAGHKVKVTMGGKSVGTAMRETEVLKGDAHKYHKEVRSMVGELVIEKAGETEIVLKLEKLKKDSMRLSVSGVELTPTRIRK